MVARIQRARIERLAGARAREVVAPMARAGYAARGVIYLVIGFFAALAPFGHGDTKDSHGALQTLLSHSFGNILAWILILGLASYAAWRTLQAVLDTDGHGTDAKGLATRAGLLGGAVSYAALTVYTAALWYGRPTGGGGGGGSKVATTIAGFVGLRVVAWVVALVLFCVCAAHIFKAVKRTYARFFDASGREMRIVDPIARTGLVARGLVFGVMSILFVYRGIDGGSGGSHPGVASALDFIRDLPAGSVLLFAAGIGLVCFSAYSFAEAFWRRVSL